MYFDNEERCADLTNGFVFKGRQVVSEQDICEMDSRKTGEKKYKARKTVSSTISGFCKEKGIWSKLCDDFYREPRKCSLCNVKAFVESRNEKLENMVEDVCSLITAVTEMEEFSFSEEKYRNEKGRINMCKAILE